MELKITHYLFFVGSVTFVFLALHAFSLLNIVVDAYSISLLIILLILPFVPRLRKIKVPGFEAEISPEVEKIEKSTNRIIKQSIDKIKPLPKNKMREYSEKEVTELSRYLYSLAENDPQLALAKLRMELELVVRDVYKSVIKKQDKHDLFSLHRMIQKLSQETAINREMLSNASDVIDISNIAVHEGRGVTRADAERMILLGMKIISYFYGYSKAIKSLEKEFDEWLSTKNKLSSI